MPTVLPPNRIFAPAQPLEKQVGGHMNPSFERLEKGKEGGMFAWSNDHILPRKGLIYPSATLNNDRMKSLSLFMLGSLGTFRPTINWLEKTLQRFNHLADKIYISEVPADGEKCKDCGQSLAGKLYRSDFMEFQYYNTCSREMWHLTYNFLRHFGVRNETAYYTGRTVATIFEYTPLYRMVMQDTFNEMKEVSRKEFKRLAKLHEERNVGIGEKFTGVFKIISLLLFIPKFKKALKFAFREAEMDKLRMDEIDIYWAMLDTRFDSFGMKIDERKQKFVEYNKLRGRDVVFN